MTVVKAAGERMGRSILHVDINNFYASVEIRDNPALAEFPVAVCGDEEARHGIVLAKNYKAKAFGVRTAEPIAEAKRKCPDLVLVPSHFEKYEKVTLESRRLLATYSDRVEPFGMDEAWLDISQYAPTDVDAHAIADELREKYKREFGLTASVGVSFTKSFAKLGSDIKKPDATTVITPLNFRDTVWSLPVESMLFIGAKTKEKLNRRGIRTIGELAKSDEALVRAWLGKPGVSLRRCANGLDFSEVMALGDAAAVKSIGNSFTPPHDLHDEREVLALLQALSETVSARLRRSGLLGTTVTVSVRDSSLFTFERQTRLALPSCISLELRDAAFKLFRENYTWQRPVRSLGLRATGLVSADEPVQLSFFDDNAARERRLSFESSIDAVREKNGNGSILSGRVFALRSTEKAVHSDGLYALK